MHSLFIVNELPSSNQFEIKEVHFVPGKGRAIAFLTQLTQVLAKKEIIVDSNDVIKVTNAVSNVESHVMKYVYSFMTYIPFTDAYNIKNLINIVRKQLDQKKEETQILIVEKAKKNTTDPYDFFSVPKESMQNFDGKNNKQVLYYPLDPSEARVIGTKATQFYESRGELLIYFQVEFDKEKSIVKILKESPMPYINNNEVYIRNNEVKIGENLNNIFKALKEGNFAVT